MFYTITITIVSAMRMIVIMVIEEGLEEEMFFLEAVGELERMDMGVNRPSSLGSD